MKKIYSLVVVLFCLMQNASSQTPITLSSQSNFTYTETFTDIANWTFSTTPTNGTFTAGIGSAAWKGNDIGGTATIPDATRITTGTTFFQTPPSGSGGYSGGVYKGTNNLVLLSTGTTDNTTSTTMDFYLNFAGVNAGTLSFDWAALNNSTGNRNGSLKIYASNDGVSFTEITAAAVNNFTNNSPTTVAGSINNVSLPTSFNNSGTARLRFYYHNGTGGTSGSRPRISIDNVKVTAVSTALCSTPTTQPTAFATGTILYNSIQFSFTHASPQPNNYLVVISNNSSLSSGPVNGVNYNVGDNLGDGNIIAITNNNSITTTGLTASTTYHFFIFSMNNSCTGGPLYLTTNPLHSFATTLAGALPCAAPSTQPTVLSFANVTTSSITGNFTAAANTDEYLIVRTTTPSFTGTINNGTLYSGGNVLGNGSVVTRTAGTTFTAANLLSGTTYYFFVFGLNRLNCTNGPVYNSSSPLTGNTTTVALPTCTTPTSQPTALNVSASNTIVNGYFTASSTADGYVVVRTTTASLSATPTNGTTYSVGTALGNGTIIENAAATCFIDFGLTASTQYYYFIFAKNSTCTGGPLYLTTTPLTGNVATTVVATNNYYYGNLHAHSSYSDGNADNTTLIPADDYAYAKNSLCMDFLGISEHNHATANMTLSKWQPGLSQATAATTANFLALYGMEWGVISNGGHVLVYGSNQLIGWETNNYNVYVPKSDYLGTPETTGTLGLFRTINNFANNSFASYAHPNFSDYNNIANIIFNNTADSAVVGCAIASGPAFSTNTTYSNPPFSFGYIDYYQLMLAKGYHIAPSMDQDSHNTTFGRTNNNRLAIVMPSLTSNNFYTAMRSRNFYATEDCDTRINFTVNNQLMGSITNGTIAPAISIYAFDPTNPTAVPSIKLMYGVPGSGVIATQIASGTGNTLNYTDFLLATNTTAYYYADITIAGNRSMSAPIWYTKNIIVPVKLLSFTASLNANRTVQLNWKTNNEVNNQLFIIEKSYNGVSFVVMDSLQANNNISVVNNYVLNDAKPQDGINYYRLKQIDKDGKFTYSGVVSINLKKTELNAVSIYPNPVRTVTTLNINSKSAGKVSVVITDVFGRIILQQQTNVIRGNQLTTLNTNGLSAGNYYVILRWNDEQVIEKLVKL